MFYYKHTQTKQTYFGLLLLHAFLLLFLARVLALGDATLQVGDERVIGLTLLEVIIAHALQIGQITLEAFFNEIVIHD